MATGDKIRITTSATPTASTAAGDVVTADPTSPTGYSTVPLPTATSKTWVVGIYAKNAEVTHSDGKVYRANSAMTATVLTFVIGTDANEWSLQTSSTDSMSSISSNLAATSLSNIATNTVIGTAASTVDLNNMFIITQTTANRTFTLPTPTAGDGTRMVAIKNSDISAVSFTMYGNLIDPNKSMVFLWDGANWSASGSMYGGSASGDSIASISSSIATVAIADITTDTVIGTAIATVDVNNMFVVTQTTINRVLTLPNPTVAAGARLVVVKNSGSSTTSFTMYGAQIDAGKSMTFSWDGTVWSANVFAQGAGTSTNVLAEYGENSSMTAGTLVVGSYTDIVGGSFTLPTTGVWEVTYTMPAQLNSVAGSFVSFRITNATNVPVPKSDCSTEIGTIGDVVQVQSIVRITTTTANEVYKMQGKVSAGATGSFINQTDSSALVLFQKISGFLPSSAQMMDYFFGIPVAASYNNQKINFTTNKGNLINNGGSITLPANKTFRLSGSVRGTSGNFYTVWRNATAGNAVIGNLAYNLSTSDSGTETSNTIATAYITTTIPTTVEFHQGTVGAESIHTEGYIEIVQIGSTGLVAGDPNLQMVVPDWTAKEWTKGALVTHTDGNVYKANSNMTISIGTFVMGTGANQWQAAFNYSVAEKGQVLPTHSSTTTSTGNVDVPNGSFTLPSAGDWEVTYNIGVQNSTTGNNIHFTLTDSANIVVPNSMAIHGLAQNVYGQATMTTRISVTASTVYKLRWRVGGGTGNILDSSNGTSVINFTKVSGMLPIALPTTSFYHGSIQSGYPYSDGTDITWTRQDGNLGVSGNSASVTLSAGNTYKLDARLSHYGVNSAVFFGFYNSTNVLLNANTGKTASYTAGASTAVGNAPIISLIYTPTVDVTVKVRVSSVVGTPTINISGESFFNVVQIGSASTIIRNQVPKITRLTDTSGTFTPDPKAIHTIVEVQAAGACGGNSSSTTGYCSCNGGGSAGAYVKAEIPQKIAGNVSWTLPATIPMTNTGQIAGFYTPGSATFGAYITAPSGIGLVSVSNQGGAGVAILQGGSVSGLGSVTLPAIEILRIAGGSGSTGYTVAPNLTNRFIKGGDGGDSVLGTGGRGADAVSGEGATSVAVAGTGYGYGGAGVSTCGNYGYAYGNQFNGGNGIIIVTETLSQ